MTKPALNHFSILALKINGLISCQFLIIQKGLTSNDRTVYSLLMTTSMIFLSSLKECLLVLERGEGREREGQKH